MGCFREITNFCSSPWTHEHSQGRKVTGALLVATGVAMVILAALFASGVMRPYMQMPLWKFYVIAAGLTVGAIIPIIAGAILLSSYIPKTIQTF